MALNNKLIVLDIDKRFNRLLLGKSLDTTGARSYRMRLIYNNSAFDLTGLTVQVGGTKPDGFGVLSSCKVIDVLKGIIEVDFTTQMLTTPGILKLEIIFLKDDIRLSSIPFEVEVIQSATNYNQMISSNDFLVFQDELKKMRAQMDAAVDKINDRYNITEDKANKLIDAMQHTVDGTIANEVYNNTYETIEGTNIKCDTKFDGYTKDLIIEGKTIQNLLPEIKNENFQLSNSLIQDGSFVLKYGENVNATRIFCPKNNELLKPNTAYTVVVDIEENTAKTALGMSAYQTILTPEKNSFENLTGRSIMKCTSKNPTDITNCLYGIQFCIWADGGNLSTNIKFKAMILEGDWTDKEIPSYFEDIKSVGDLNNNKVNILSSGKNLIDLENILNEHQISYTNIDGDYSFTLKQSLFSTGILNMNKKGEFVLSCKIKNGTAVRPRFTFVYADGTAKGSISSESTTSFTNIKLVSDPTKTILYLRLDWSVAGSLIIKELQLTEGDEILPFEKPQRDKKEISLPISYGLKSLPNGVCDRVYEKNGEVILEQNVGKVALDGQMNWTDPVPIKGKNAWAIGANVNGWYDNTCKVNAFVSTIKPIIHYSSDEIGFSQIIKTRITMTLPNSITGLNADSISSDVISKFKSLLNKDNIIVYYQLSEPIYHKIEDYKRLKLRLYNGESYVNSNNIVKPIIKFGYPGTLRSSVDNTFESITDMIPEDIGALSPENLGKWRFFDRDLKVNDKRALVGYNDADGNRLVINYGNDFKNGVYIYGPVVLDGLPLGAVGANGFKKAIPIIDAAQVMEIGKYIDFHCNADSSVDFHSRIECAGNRDLKVIGHLAAVDGYLTSNSNDNKAILGTGPKDIFVCNNKSQKYLQLKNDGDLCYSDRKVQLDPQASPLWRGYHHMTDDETITPTKKLSQCTNGWVLVWSDFNAGGTGEDYNFCLTYIPKNTPWKNGQGYNFCTPTDMGDDSFTAKYIYVFDDHIAGHKDNKTGKRADVVIRAILEY